MNAVPIPKSILHLLSEPWRVEGEYSHFDAVFAKEKRRIDPSYYVIHVGTKVETDMDTFSHDDAMALAADDAFGTNARTRESGNVVINEHAQHALVDFCSDVYAAWKKYQDRLQQIEAACPFPVSE